MLGHSNARAPARTTNNHKNPPCSHMERRFFSKLPQKIVRARLTLTRVKLILTRGKLILTLGRLILTRGKRIRILLIYCGVELFLSGVNSFFWRGDPFPQMR